MPKEDTQFKPGQSGNPAGGIKKTDSWRAIMERVCDEQHKLENRDVTKKELIVRVIANMAMEGNLGAAEKLMDRMEGKAEQKLDETVRIIFDTPDEANV